MTEFKCTCIIDNHEYKMQTNEGRLMGNAYDQFSAYLDEQGLDIDNAECLAIDAIDYHDA